MLCAFHQGDYCSITIPLPYGISVVQILVDHQEMTFVATLLQSILNIRYQINPLYSGYNNFLSPNLDIETTLQQY